jgi:cyclopropane-fatty-acyl-phospholipid synthase
MPASASARPDRNRQRVASLLARADVRLGGDRPWDLQVHDPRLFARLLAHGSLGLGEAYMDGWWEAPRVDALLARLLKARLDEAVVSWADVWDAVRARLSNRQSGPRAFEVGEQHYDLGNDLYAAMLGTRLVYSCGFWRTARTLDGAQLAKLDLIAAKLQFAPGMRVLDIGCGWGEALAYFADRYGIEGVGITISREQSAYARALCAGKPVEIRLQDYRKVNEPFDRIYSIGMFEHVGVRNYRAYFEVVHRCLSRHGLTLLHTIGGNRSGVRTDPWIERYIFPNSMLPSAAQITRASEGLFVLEDWRNFGPDYDRTLQAWRDNIEAAWDRLPARYDERFRRMWRFYLHASMAVFRTRHAQLWQIVLARDGIPGGYIAPR